MIYLSGQVTVAISDPRGGWMLQPRMQNRVDLGSGRPWAADTGCYRAKKFDEERWLAWLAAMAPYASSCLLATAPDVVEDPVSTWQRSEPLLPVVRALGFPAALVAQDGIERSPIEWEAFDVLFLGGSTRWKESDAAWQLTRAAAEHGKPVHMGRVNSLRRLRKAAAFGCRSVDGTYLAFRLRAHGHRGEREGSEEVAQWLEIIRREPCLPLTPGVSLAS